MSLFNASRHSVTMNPRDRPSDPLSRLRYALETMPSSRKYTFSLATRAEVLSELYDAFWGPYSHLFLPLSNSSLPMHATLSNVQADLGFAGAGSEDPVVPGRPCGHIFSKGESCFRCKWVHLFLILPDAHSVLPETALSTIAAFCVAAASMPAITPITTSASSSLSRLVAVVIAET